MLQSVTQRKGKIEKLTTKLMLWCGKQAGFAYTQLWSEEPGSPTRVVHFAKSERDFNTACRQRVEWLDAGGYTEEEE